MVWDKALECRMDRGTTFLALGGGVIGDMTGFAAACYQRGVHFVQVPTTVMSQVGTNLGEGGHSRRILSHLSSHPLGHEASDRTAWAEVNAVMCRCFLPRWILPSEARLGSIIRWGRI